MELAELFADVAADVAAEILVEVLAKIAGGTELEARVEIRQLKKLEVFGNLRLSIVITTEALAEITTEITSGTKLNLNCSSSDP